jgi:hypothetical protein
MYQHITAVIVCRFIGSATVHVGRVRKVKVSLEQAMKAQRRSRVIALLFL